MALFTKSFLIYQFVLILICGCTVDVSEQHWRSAEQYVRQGQNLRAVEEFTRIVNYGPKTPMASRALIRIAEVYEQQIKDYPRAIRAYRDAIRRSDEVAIKIQARRSIGLIYSEKMEMHLPAAEEFTGLFEELAKSTDSGPDVLLLLAKSLMDGGAFEEASGRYQEFRNLYPGHKEGPRSILFQARSKLMAKKEQEATELYRKFIADFSGRSEYGELVAEAYYGLGESLEEAEDLLAAVEAYRKAMGLYPNRGVIELKLQRIEKRTKEKAVTGKI